MDANQELIEAVKGWFHLNTWDGAELFRRISNLVLNCQGTLTNTYKPLLTI